MDLLGRDPNSVSFICSVKDLRLLESALRVSRSLRHHSALAPVELEEDASTEEVLMTFFTWTLNNIAGSVSKMSSNFGNT